MKPRSKNSKPSRVSKKKIKVTQADVDFVFDQKPARYVPNQDEMLVVFSRPITDAERLELTSRFAKQVIDAMPSFEFTFNDI